jgi:DNA polymerase
MRNALHERMLLEMGLGPLWKRRALVALSPAGPPQGPAGVPEQRAVAGAAMALPERADAGRRSASLPTVAVHEDASSGADGERGITISRMDWPALREAVAGCAACSLCKTRKNTVFGVGNESAGWMIIGEAPGAEEDARGEPFVGQAGQLLDAMLAALEMRRDRDVYIANVLKCRPPGNRNPEPGEVAQCSPHLLRQVALVRPKVILLMGRFAAQAILGTDASIASLRGRRHRFGGTDVVVTYHPAYLLRTLTDKSKAWQDLLFARAVATSPGEAATASTPRT